MRRRDGGGRRKEDGGRGDTEYEHCMHCGKPHTHLNLATKQPRDCQFMKKTKERGYHILYTYMYMHVHVCIYSVHCMKYTHMYIMYIHMYLGYGEGVSKMEPPIHVGVGECHHVLVLMTGGRMYTLYYKYTYRVYMYMYI